MAVAKCTAVSGRSRGQFLTHSERLQALWPSFCAHAEIEQWPAAGPLARKRRRALVERLLAHAKGHAGPAASTHRIAVARGPVLWLVARRRRHRWSPRCPSRRVSARGRRRAEPAHPRKEHTASTRATHTQRHNARRPAGSRCSPRARARSSRPSRPRGRPRSSRPSTRRRWRAPRPSASGTRLGSRKPPPKH